jgi:type IV secretion system protein TrbL
MVLLVGIGKSFVDQYHIKMSAGIQMKELGVMLIVTVVLLVLTNTTQRFIAHRVTTRQKRISKTGSRRMG